MIRVPLVRPAVGEEEVAAAARVLRSGWLTQGPEVARFEEEFAAAVGAPHAIAVSSCTAALELTLRALGIGAGDDVATVSHSFIATANAVVATGARPLFIDVDPATFGMDPNALAAHLTPATRAVLCVHQLGIPCDIGAIARVAAGRGIPVIEDAACAVGSELTAGGPLERVGRPRGVAACFSFHPRKVVTTGDGGMITTRDADLAQRLRRARQHGMSVPDTVRHQAQEVIFEEYLEPAHNFRMTDVQAAVGRPQLARLDAILAERRRLAARYADRLGDLAFARPYAPPGGVRSNWQSFPLVLRDESGVAQRPLLEALLRRGIGARRGVHNAHQEPAYADRARWSCGDAACTGRCPHLPHSERARDGTVLIPLFHGMSDAEQDQVIAALHDIPQEHR